MKYRQSYGVRVEFYEERAMSSQSIVFLRTCSIWSNHTCEVFEGVDALCAGVTFVVLELEVGERHGGCVFVRTFCAAAVDGADFN